MDALIHDLLVARWRVAAIKAGALVDKSKN